MVPDRLDKLDYYRLLGVAPDADEAELRRAFRKFARRYHPDRFAGQGSERVARATAIYRRGSEAFQTLLDPASRRTYNRTLRSGKLRLAADERESAAHKEELRMSSPMIKGLAIQSPAAMAFYRKAVSAIQAEDWLSALSMLRAAADHEPDNFVIEARLEQVEAQLRRR